MSDDEQGMTHEELMALPVAVTLDTANRALLLGRTTGYTLARCGKYPVPLLRHGRQYRVARAHLHRHLGVAAEGPSGNE
ncbi:integrase [Streptomyces sp. NPDC091204]|uniref:integrase n=1 Tax=Streptomyces sp. NPDC091204 TaxID=3155299 RepID=UPI0034187D73